MDAARHQEVARALRRRGRQDRRRIFGEARLAHAPAHLGDDLRARHDVLVQRVAAQVEEAVFQPDVLGIVGLAEHRQRQLPGRRQHLDLARENLDLAGRQIGVDGIAGARLDLAVDADHPFAAHRLGGLEGRRIRIGDDLRQAVVVAQVDEQQPAMVADAVHPARKADGGADVGFPQLGAGMAAVSMHGCRFRFWDDRFGAPGRTRRGGPKNLREKRMQGGVCQGDTAERRIPVYGFKPRTLRP